MVREVRPPFGHHVPSHELLFVVSQQTAYPTSPAEAQLTVTEVPWPVTPFEGDSFAKLVPDGGGVGGVVEEPPTVKLNQVPLSASVVPEEFIARTCQ